MNAALALGTIVNGTYEIVRELGAGGMGAVYAARHVHLGRKVAIKVLHGDLTRDPGVVARFHREAQLAASIGHDNICEVTEVGQFEDGSPFLVMPLLKGVPFTALLHSAEPLAVLRVCDIACQTLAALEAAHDAKIVHRDLKPDNIFITQMGDRRDFVKLLDFGVSKILDQDEVGELTRSGVVLGTPYYMAPEQARGAKEIDHRVDLYAMGVILYEAFTGVRPFVGASYNEIMFRILTAPFAPPRSLNPALTPELERVVLRAMERDPAERFASAAEMRRAILDAASAAGGSLDIGTETAELSIPRDSPFAPPVSGTRGRLAPSSPRLRRKAAVLAAAVFLTAGAALFAISRSAPTPTSSTRSSAIPVSTARPQSPTTTAPPEKVEAQAPPVASSPVEAVLAPTASVAGPSALASKKEASERRSSRRASRRVEDGQSAAAQSSAKPADTKSATGERVDGRFGTKLVTDYE